MNLFILGDNNYGNPDTFPLLSRSLDAISDDYGMIDKIVTFPEDGVCWLATVYAHDNEIPFDVLDTKEQRKLWQQNSYLRSVVDSNSIDAFLFMFLDGTVPVEGMYDNKEQAAIENFEKNVRWWYSRAVSHFKRQLVFTNKDLVAKKVSLAS